MKIAYILSWPLLGGGVERKIATQAREWSNQGSTVRIFVVTDEFGQATNLDFQDVVIFRKHDTPSKHLPGLKYLAANHAFKCVNRAISLWNPDLVYYRMGYPPKSVINIARTQKLVVEINNNDLQEIVRNRKWHDPSRYLLSLYMRRAIKSLLRSASGIIAVTNELINTPQIRRVGCPKLALPNAVNLGDYQPLRPTSSFNSPPRIAFLGGAEHSNGMKRIIDLAKATLGRLEFYIIGRNSPKQITENVRVWGLLKRHEYEPLLKECDIGLSTLALHEKGIKEACSLKVREYLAFGLPIVLAYNDTALESLEQPWILRIPDSPTGALEETERIVDFAQRMRGFRLPHEQVAQYIDSSHIEKTRLDFFEKITAM